MSREELSRSPEWELVHDSQDVRGWPVIDASGKTLGKVSDFIIDTEQERVTSLVLDTGGQVAARDVQLGDHVLSMGGVGAQARATGGAQVRGRSNDEMRIPIVEEELRIGKRAVEGGGVRVNVRTEEKPVDEEVRLREERVIVERNPVNRPATEQELRAAGKGGAIEMTERSEEAVVDKKARVVEEVVVKKVAEERTENVHDKIHRTDVDVEKISAKEKGGNPPKRK